MSTRELCVVCGKAYVDDVTGKCPNGCTGRLAQNLLDALTSRDGKKLSDLTKQIEKGAQKTQANTWAQQQKQKRQKQERGRKYIPPTNSSDDSDDTSTSNEDSSSGMICPNCRQTGTHAEWCPWND